MTTTATKPKFKVGDRVRVLERNQLHQSIWGTETEVVEVIEGRLGTPTTVSIRLSENDCWLRAQDQQLAPFIQLALLES